MTAPTALYQEVILEHGHHPRRQGPLADATHEASGDNPLCGDRVTIRLRVEDGAIADARAEVRGCLIAIAAASLLCEAIAGRAEAEALGLIESVLALEGHGPLALGPLEVLSAARDFPGRISCATLAAKAGLAALSGSGARR